MRIAVFGLGYVGSVSGACLAKLGHDVVGVDLNKEKVELINQGSPPVTEKGLRKLTENMVRKGKLRATLEVREAINESEVAFICVGTPSTATGSIYSAHLERVCAQIGGAIYEEKARQYVVFNRSTCLPNVHRHVRKILREKTKYSDVHDIGYICHPEFLREGDAINDFLNPAKIVFGLSDEQYKEVCTKIYAGIQSPIFYTSVDVAGLSKYADNCFHATKIAFANEIGMLCKAIGVDSNKVMNLLISDSRLNISDKYLTPGMAFGGSCLPKDLRAILKGAKDLSTPLPMLNGVLSSNSVQVERVLERITKFGRTKIGIIGLAFKEGTDDTRESPILDIVKSLKKKQYRLRIYDQNICIEKLVGVNRENILSPISDLANCLKDDLTEVVGWAETIVVAHRLKPEVWEAICWEKRHLILDLVNIPALRKAPNYEGLYW